MGFPVSGCGTRGFAAQTVLARDDTEKPHLLPTAPAIVRPANTPPLVVADTQSGFLFLSSRIANPDGQHSGILASDLKLTRWSYLISNAIDIKKETLRKKNTSIMIMSRKKCYICGAILSLPNRNREKQNAGVHDISPYDKE